MAFLDSSLSLPPTPPRAQTDPGSSPAKDVELGIQSALDFLDTSYDAHEKSPLKKKAASVLNTPPTSSPTAGESAHLDCEGRRKHLRFSSETRFCDDGPNESCSSSPIQALRILPSSRDQKASKPILKASSFAEFDLANTQRPDSPPLESFVDMLDSVLQQLAGSDLLSRRSAYHTLATCLEEYENGLPDPVMFSEKRAVFEQYIQRDSSLHDNKSLSHKLLHLAAVKFAIVMTWKLPEDNPISETFTTFIVDRYLVLVNETIIPKDIALDYMTLLSLRGIYNKAMTPERLRRILLSLRDIHKRITGNNVRRIRFSVFTRVLRNLPTGFLEPSVSIMAVIFEGIMSPDRDLRKRAVEFAKAMCAILPRSPRLAHLLEKTFQGPVREEVFLNYFSRKIQAQASDKDDARLVPQIWSIVMSMASGKDKLVRTLLLSQPWLSVITSCFNNRSHAIMLATWEAWNTTVLAATGSFHEDVIFKRLLQPIIAYLQRKAHSPQSEMTRDAALSTYRVFLYHAFRQTRQNDDILKRWTLLVHAPIKKTLRAEHSDPRPLLQAVAALIFESKSNFCGPQRGLKVTDGPLTDCELPRLEASWVRANSISVLETFDLLADCVLRLSDPLVDSLFASTWQSFVKAITTAGSKEITTSPELRKTIALLTNFLRKILEESNIVPTKCEAWTIRLLMLAVDEIGTEIFTEEFLTSLPNGTFSSHSSPGRPQQTTSDLCSPIASVLKLLASKGSTSSLQRDRTSPFNDKLHELLLKSLATKSSTIDRVHFLLSCLPKPGDPPCALNSSLWHAKADPLSQEVAKHAQDATADKVKLDPNIISGAISVLSLGQTLCESGCVEAGSKLCSEVGNTLSKFPDTLQSHANMIETLRAWYNRPATEGRSIAAQGLYAQSSPDKAKLTHIVEPETSLDAAEKLHSDVSMSYFVSGAQISDQMRPSAPVGGELSHSSDINSIPYDESCNAAEVEPPSALEGIEDQREERSMVTTQSSMMLEDHFLRMNARRNEVSDIALQDPIQHVAAVKEACAVATESAPSSQGGKCKMIDGSPHPISSLPSTSERARSVTYSDPFVLIDRPAPKGIPTSPEPSDLEHEDSISFSFENFTPIIIEDDDEGIVCIPRDEGVSSVLGLLLEQQRASQTSSARTRRVSQTVRKSQTSKQRISNTIDKEADRPIQSELKRRRSQTPGKIHALVVPNGSQRRKRQTSEISGESEHAALPASKRRRVLRPERDSTDPVKQSDESAAPSCAVDQEIVSHESDLDMRRTESIAAADRNVVGEVEASGDHDQGSDLFVRDSSPAQHPTMTPRSFMARVQDLIQDAKRLIFPASQENVRADLRDLSEVLHTELARI